MKTPLTYGFLMAVGGALLTLVLYFAGFHDTPEKMNSAQWTGIIVSLAICALCLALAMREKRALRPPENPWGYGSAFGTGVVTGLFGVLFGAVFAYIYVAFINPGMSDVILQLQVNKMEAAGASAANIERVEPMLKKWMTPGMLTLSQSISGLIFAVLVSLVVAIFHRRPVATAPLAGVPPPVT